MPSFELGTRGYLDRGHTQTSRLECDVRDEQVRDKGSLPTVGDGERAQAPDASNFPAIHLIDFPFPSYHLQSNAYEQ